ncbi:MAG TPA: addiction module protein [Segetibacter sp.]
MQLQYVHDNNGETTAVIIPIEEWLTIKNRFPQIDEDEELPQWQKDLIDRRLANIKENPGSLIQIDELFHELDRDE